MSAPIRRSARLGALALLAGLAAPQAASAAPTAGAPNTVVLSGTVITATAADGKNDLIRIEQESANVVTLRTRLASGTTWPATPENLSPECVYADDGSSVFRRIRCTAPVPITNVIVNGRDGNDTLQVLTAPATPVDLRGGEGTDTLIGGDRGDKLHGEAGNDTLYGEGGDDAMSGGEDNDLFIGGAGGDDMAGDAGFDLVTYDERLPDQSVKVSLDDVDNDGVEGEGDNARTSIEDVMGGQGPDEITGSDLANELTGLKGNDVIVGGGGTDKFVGGDGNDTIASRDGNPERIDCGEEAGDPDTDTAKTDEIDETSGCEVNEATSTVQRDRDGDGFRAPPDCDDDNRAVNPAAHDVPENGVDENCDEADAIITDRDGDGFNRDVDCNDANPNARPGGKEVVGNTVDENCDFVAMPTPVIETPISPFFDHEDGITTVINLGIGKVPRGTTARVICTGGKRFGCPFKVKKKVFKRASRRGVNWTRHFRGAKLRRGATIIVQITKRGYIGRHVIFKMKPKAAPIPKPMCLFPGKKKARTC